MAWVPIADAGVDFTFNPNSAAVTMVGSVISADGTQADAGFVLTMNQDAVEFRVSIQSYSADTGGNGITDLPFFEWIDSVGTQTVTNASATPETSFSPSPFAGTVALTGDALIYTSAQGSEWSIFETYGHLLEVEVPEPEACAEIGRVTRALVSAYDRSRVHQGIVRVAETRCVVANFNGAIPKGRTIVSVTWRTTAPWVGRMSNPSISGRQAQVMCAFQYEGVCAMRAEVTLDNGEIYSQVFRFRVFDTPWFDGPFPNQQGPFSVTATA